MIRWKTHLKFAVVAAFFFGATAIPSAAPLKVQTGHGSISDLIVEAQTNDSGYASSDAVDPNNRTSSSRRGQLTARRKGESWVRNGSRRFRSKIRNCVTVAKRNASDGRDCFSTALEQYADWIERPKTVLQEKPRIVRSIRQAAAATNRAGSNRVAAAAVKRAAQEVRASVQLITLADDSLVNAEKRSVDVIANDLEVASAALLTIQGVWLIYDLVTQEA